MCHEELRGLLTSRGQHYLSFFLWWNVCASHPTWTFTHRYKRRFPLEEATELFTEWWSQNAWSSQSPLCCLLKLIIAVFSPFCSSCLLKLFLCAWVPSALRRPLFFVREMRGQAHQWELILHTVCLWCFDPSEQWYESREGRSGWRGRLLRHST